MEKLENQEPAPTELSEPPIQPEIKSQPPLTDEQIKRMDEARYPKFLSQEEIDSINRVRARGIHHGIT